jgi:hypothetical protein
MAGSIVGRPYDYPDRVRIHAHINVGLIVMGEDVF